MLPDRRTLSLRTLLVLLVAAVALPLTALAGLAVWHAHDQARGRAEAEVLGQARTMTALVDREIQRVETGLRALADSASLARGDLAGVESEMRAMAAQLDGTSIGLASPDGQLLSTAWAPGERRPQAPVPPAMHETFRTGRPKVSNLVTSQNTGRPVVAVVVPVSGAPDVAGRSAGADKAGPATAAPGSAVPGTPIPDTPASDTPASGTPVSGTPVSGTPASGTLVPGTHAPETPKPDSARSGTQGAGQGVTPRSRPRYVFAAALPDGRLAVALRERAEPDSETRIAAVTDRTGVIIARSADEAEYLGKMVGPGFASQFTSLPDGVLHDAATYEGSLATFAFATAPRSGFTVALSLPESEFSAPLWQALRQVGILAAAILAGGAMLAAMLAARIARALHHLTDPTAQDRPILREVDALAHALTERDQAMERVAISERRFRALARAGALVLWHSDADGAIQDAEGWQALTGQPDASLRGTGWLTMLHPDDLVRTLGAWQNARQQDRPIDIEYRVRTAAGDWHWVRARAVPVRNGHDAAEWVGVVEDVDRHRQAALALADREERLRLAVSAARLTTWEYDPVADRGSRVSAASEAITAPAASGFTLAEWTASVHPDDRPATHALLQATIAGEVPEFITEFRVRRRAPAEGWAWIATHGAVAARDPMTGAVLRLAGVSQDVSERREAEQRRILLAREVDHRAKNVLAVVQSVLRLTRRDQPEAFVATVEARVAALARAHTLLAEEGWVGADLRMLAERETASWPSGSVTLVGPPLAVAAAAVQPLAMVLHELATNAAKHGAASRLGGKVTLSWTVEGCFVTLCWLEQGGPAVQEAPARRGFGSRMIDAIVRGQLGGALTLDWQPSGLECRMHLPAGRMLAVETLGPRRQAGFPAA